MEGETLTNGQAADDFQDLDQNDDTAKLNELTQAMEGLEKEKSDLIQENQDMKEKLKKLTIQMEKVQSEGEEMKEKLGVMKKEIEQADDDKKVLESIAARALELETEVSRLQHDLISAMSEGQDANLELGELKKVLGEKTAKIDGLEMEIEVLKKDKAEIEKKVRELERKLGVLEVKESEERSKRLRVEEEIKDKIGEKDKAISDLKKNVENLESVIANSVKEIEKFKSEEKAMEKKLQASEEKAKSMELKILLLEKNTTEAENVLNENDTEVVKRSVDSEEDKQWLVLAIGSAGAFAVVTGIACVCYLNKRR